MKNKILVLVGIIIVAALAVYGCYVIFEEQKDYYTKIDNTKVKAIDSSDDMKYEYTLVAYDKDGHKKEFKFKTVRILRDEAYLKLDTMFIVGVRKWAEVQYEVLPKKVQEKYKNESTTSD